MQGNPNDAAHSALMARILTNFYRLVENINELTRRLEDINEESEEMRQLSDYWQQYLENVQLVLQKLYE